MEVEAETQIEEKIDDNIEIFHLDDVTQYWFGMKNGRPDCVNIKIDTNATKTYTKSYIRDYLFNRNYKGTLVYDEKNDFVIDKPNNLILIPLVNEDKIVLRFTITLYTDFPKIDGKRFTWSTHPQTKKSYASQTDDKKVSLIATVFGRKAHKGGWEKIYYEEEAEEELEEETEKEGEQPSQDTLEPPLEEEFDEDELNSDEQSPIEPVISKDATENKTRHKIQKGEETWIYGEGVPDIREGEFGDFYRDTLTGETYKKTPSRVLDHINSDSLDNRSTNIREIPRGLNSANRIKQANCSSKYLGVKWHASPRCWMGSITYDYVRYSKTFTKEEDAAKFRDILAVHFYKLPMSNNGMLTEEEIKDILERGIDAIPYQYFPQRLYQRDLPPNINKYWKDTYRAAKKYKGKLYAEICDSLEEAKIALERIIAQIEAIKEEEKLQWQKDHENDLDGEFGYICTHDRFKNCNGRYKVTREFWFKYAHLSWRKIAGYAYTTIKGVNCSMHYLYYKLQNPDYECYIHGTIDHTQRDKYDCTLVNLRAATASEQSQNRDVTRKNKTIPYQGICLIAAKYHARISKNKDDGTTDKVIGISRIYMEDAARDYNDLVLKYYGKEGKTNVIPDTKTTVNDIYDKKFLTIEKIKNITTSGEIRTIFYVNRDWMKRAEISTPRIVNKHNKGYYRQIIINLKEEDNKGYVSPIIYHKSNLCMQYIDELDNIGDVRRIFSHNYDWRYRLDGTYINNIKSMDINHLEYCKELFRIYMQIELEERERFYQETGIILQRAEFVSKFILISEKTINLKLIDKIDGLNDLKEIMRIKTQWYRKSGICNFKYEDRHKIKELFKRYIIKEEQMKKAGIEILPDCVCLEDEIDGSEVPEIDINSVDSLRVKDIKKILKEHFWWYTPISYGGLSNSLIKELNVRDLIKKHILREKIMRQNGILINKPKESDCDDDDENLSIAKLTPDFILNIQTAQTLKKIVTLNKEFKITRDEINYDNRFDYKEKIFKFLFPNIPYLPNNMNLSKNEINNLYKHKKIKKGTIKEPKTVLQQPQVITTVAGSNIPKLRLVISQPEIKVEKCKPKLKLNIIK